MSGTSRHARGTGNAFVLMGWSMAWVSYVSITLALALATKAMKSLQSPESFRMAE